MSLAPVPTPAVGLQLSSFVTTSLVTGVDGSALTVTSDDCVSGLDVVVDDVSDSAGCGTAK
eukprot:52577-Lingulodinium_polyedra.AAC.1